MMTKEEFRVELKRRLDEKIVRGMEQHIWIQVSFGAAMELVAECLVDAGVLKKD